MSIFDGIFIGLIVLFFVMVMLYVLGDLFRDMGYYRRKQKNVVALTKAHHKRQPQKNQAPKPQTPNVQRQYKR
ncbi:MAG: hypothetical protein PWP51_2725 [Clostridiales bacterium]|jgi:hypothetical protein|nr:hypothetical protein [Clostridiales bacterium]MDN5300172.1 hypothetical protein [Clostridiales bacterium]